MRNRITAWSILLAFVLMPWRHVSALNEEQVTTQNLLTRWYELGERVSYRMTATTSDRTGATNYLATVSRQLNVNRPLAMRGEIGPAPPDAPGPDVPHHQRHQREGDRDMHPQPGLTGDRAHQSGGITEARDEGEQRHRGQQQRHPPA